MYRNKKQYIHIIRVNIVLANINVYVWYVCVCVYWTAIYFFLWIIGSMSSQKTENRYFKRQNFIK